MDTCDKKSKDGCAGCSGCGMDMSDGSLDITGGDETEEYGTRKKPGAGYYALVLIICIGAIVAASALARFVFFK